MPKTSSGRGRRSPKGEGGWSRRLEEPIEIDGKRLRTLRDAGQHIAGLKPAIQREAQWQTAAEMLLKSAERGWPVLFAQIAFQRAARRDTAIDKTGVKRRVKRARKYRIVR